MNLNQHKIIFLFSVFIGCLWVLPYWFLFNDFINPEHIKIDKDLNLLILLLVTIFTTYLYISYFKRTLHRVISTISSFLFPSFACFVYFSLRQFIDVCFYRNTYEVSFWTSIWYSLILSGMFPIISFFLFIPFMALSHYILLQSDKLISKFIKNNKSI